jgi:hypothetical protein
MVDELVDELMDELMVKLLLDTELVVDKVGVDDCVKLVVVFVDVKVEDVVLVMDDELVNEDDDIEVDDVELWVEDVEPVPVDLLVDVEVEVAEEFVVLVEVAVGLLVDELLVDE